MKTEQEILEELQELKLDERCYYDIAVVTINPPLAIIQIMLETKINTLESVLNLKLSRFPLKK